MYTCRELRNKNMDGSMIDLCHNAGSIWIIMMRCIQEAIARPMLHARRSPPQQPHQYKKQLPVAVVAMVI